MGKILSSTTLKKLHKEVRMKNQKLPEAKVYASL